MLKSGDEQKKTLERFRLLLILDQLMVAQGGNFPFQEVQRKSGRLDKLLFLWWPCETEWFKIKCFKKRIPSPTRRRRKNIQISGLCNCGFPSAYIHCHHVPHTYWFKGCKSFLPPLPLKNNNNKQKKLSFQISCPCLNGRVRPDLSLHRMYRALWHAFVNLKNRSPLFYQQKWVYSKITENCNSGHANYGKTIDKSKKTKERNFSLWRRKLGGFVLNGSLLEKSKRSG